MSIKPISGRANLVVATKTIYIKIVVLHNDYAREPSLLMRLHRLMTYQVGVGGLSKSFFFFNSALGIESKAS